MFVKIAKNVWVNVAHAESVRIGHDGKLKGPTLFLNYPEGRRFVDEEFSIDGEEYVRLISEALNTAASVPRNH